MGHYASPNNFKKVMKHLGYIFSLMSFVWYCLCGGAEASTIDLLISLFALVWGLFLLICDSRKNGKLEHATRGKN